MTGNRQILLTSRPDGAVKASDFTVVDGDVPTPADGEFAVRVELISIDPAMRTWMNAVPSYVPPVDLDSVMRAGAIGTVIESRHDRFPVGAVVYGEFGVQEYAVSDGAGCHVVDVDAAPKSTYLGALGITGITAYFGLTDVARIREGDTVVVSGAAGAVGSMVGQIAKIKGCRTIGIAGGPDKCATLIDEFGFDAAIDYRNDDVRRKLKEYAPNGIDVYFDNVGGPILEAALGRLARGARIVLCGAVSQYNDAVPRGPRNYMSLLVARASMTGMVVFDYEDRYDEALTQLAAWRDAGRLTSAEHIVPGVIDDFPQTLAMLFAGENLGKLILALPAASEEVSA